MPRKRASHAPRYNDPFPAGLRVLLKKTGTTQQQLAEAIGMRNRQSIGNYCSGLATPDLQIFTKIVEYFGVSPYELLGIGEEVETQKSAKKRKKPDGRFPVFQERLQEVVGRRSVTEFAKELQISRQTLGFYLNGDRIPDALTLANICERCGISADWLLGLSETKSSNFSIRAVCKATQLSESAVAALMVSTPEERQLINGTICSKSYVVAEKIRSDIEEWEVLKK